MCCSVMAAVRDISFPSHSWVVGHFRGSRLNLMVTRANSSRYRSSSVPVPPLQVISRAGTEKPGWSLCCWSCSTSRSVWRAQIMQRSKMWFSGFQSTLLRAEDRGFRLSSSCQGLFSLTLVSCSFSSHLAWMCVCPLLFSSQIPALSSAVSHAVLSISWRGFPFPAAHVSQRVPADSSAEWLLGGRAGHTAGWL